MNKNYTKTTRFILLLVFLVSLTACKIVDLINENTTEAKTTSNTVSQGDIIEETLPVTDSEVNGGINGGVNNGIDHEHSDDVIQVPPFYREPSPSTLSYIKVNDSPIEINLNSSSASSDNYLGGKNNSVAKTQRANIQSIEFGFIATKQDQAYKSSIDISLRSLSGPQNLNINYSKYLYDEFNGVGKFEEHISFNYEDYKAGIHASAYASSLAEIKNVFTISEGSNSTDNSTGNSTGNSADKNTDKIFINVTALLDNFRDSTNTRDDPNLYQNPEQVDYDIASRFFADELFSLRISMGEAILYEGRSFWAINNCIFASIDTPPADVDDICKAYMALK